MGMRIVDVGVSCFNVLNLDYVSFVNNARITYAMITMCNVV